MCEVYTRINPESEDKSNTYETVAVADVAHVERRVAFGPHVRVGPRRVLNTSGCGM